MSRADVIITPPHDPRHQRFADLLLKGETSLTDAYRAAGFKGTADSAKSAASRLRKRKDVSDYIAAVQAATADESTLSLLEIRRFLARIVRTPVTALEPDDKNDANLDLIKKIRRKFNAEDESTTEELEKLDPLKAIEIDLKISGNDPETNALQQLAEAVSQLAPSTPIPTGKL